MQYLCLIETKYKLKCIELRKRTREIEQHNELMALSISRTKRDIKRLRLERALLLEKLEERTLFRVDDSDGTPSPPGSPGKSIGALPQEMLEIAAASVAASAQQALQATGSIGALGVPSNGAGGIGVPTNSGSNTNPGATLAATAAAAAVAAGAAAAAGGSSANGISNGGSGRNNSKRAGTNTPKNATARGNRNKVKEMAARGKEALAAAAAAAIAAETSYGDNDEDNDSSTPSGDTNTKASSSKKSNTSRDPNQPRRPQNAYIIFCERAKEQVKANMEKERPGLPYDLTKAMSDAWHSLPNEAKQKFYKIYEDDRERYTREMAHYLPPNPTPSDQREKMRYQKQWRELLKAKEKKAQKALEVESSVAANSATEVSNPEETVPEADENVKIEDDDGDEQKDDIPNGNIIETGEKHDDIVKLEEDGEHDAEASLEPSQEQVYSKSGEEDSFSESEGSDNDEGLDHVSQME